jgi:hypothetical protein
MCPWKKIWERWEFLKYVVDDGLELWVTLCKTKKKST